MMRVGRCRETWWQRSGLRAGRADPQYTDEPQEGNPRKVLRTIADCDLSLLRQIRKRQFPSTAERFKELNEIERDVRTSANAAPKAEKTSKSCAERICMRLNFREPSALRKNYSVRVSRILENARSFHRLGSLGPALHRTGLPVEPVLESAIHQYH
jgi:hypothetical protein